MIENELSLPADTANQSKKQTVMLSDSEASPNERGMRVGQVRSEGVY